MANEGENTNVAATYILIYSFLSGRQHYKAAQALKKAVQDVVVLKDDAAHVDPPLDVIIQEWRKLKVMASSSSFLTSSSSSSDSSSSDPDSDSDSSSDDTSDDSSSSSGDTSSSSDTEAPASASRPAAVKAEARPSSLTLTSGSELDQKTPIVRKSSPAGTTSTSDSDSDSDSDASDSPTETINTKSQIASQATAASAKTVSTTEVRTTKRRRIDESGTAVVTALAIETQIKTTNSATETPQTDQTQKGGKQARRTNAPFQRIKVDRVNFADERLKDNTFDGKPASTNDYGARASRDLIVTRGDGFRKEKNKKKRGSYRGGEITMATNSIKFT